MGVSVTLARGQTRLFRNVSLVKKVNSAVINTEQSRNSLQGEHLPSYLNVGSKDTEQVLRSCQECCIPRYLNVDVVS